MAWVGPCGHVRDPDLDKPCPSCVRLTKEREWDKEHPDQEKCLKEKGWCQVFAEGIQNPLGWWHSEFGPKIFDFFTAVREQREKDMRPQPQFREKNV